MSHSLVNQSSEFLRRHSNLYKEFSVSYAPLFISNKSRRFRWAGHVARMEESRSAFKILTGKPTGKRPLGRPRRRWGDKIKMDLEEIWIDSAQDRNYWSALVNATLNLRVP